MHKISSGGEYTVSLIVFATVVEENINAKNNAII